MSRFVVGLLMSLGAYFVIVGFLPDKTLSSTLMLVFGCGCVGVVIGEFYGKVGDGQQD